MEKQLPWASLSEISVFSILNVAKIMKSPNEHSFWEGEKLGSEITKKRPSLLSISFQFNAVGSHE